MSFLVFGLFESRNFRFGVRWAGEGLRGLGAGLRVKDKVKRRGSGTPLPFTLIQID